MTIEDFRERRMFREREMISPSGYLGIGKSRVYVGDQRFTPTELRRAEQAQKRWEARNWDAHTIDRDVQHIAHTMRSDRLWAWCTFWCFVGAAIGYAVTRFVVLGLVGG